MEITTLGLLVSEKPTICELCDSLGVTRGKRGAYLAKSKAVLLFGGPCNSYYRLVVRGWGLGEVVISGSKLQPGSLQEKLGMNAAGIAGENAHDRCCTPTLPDSCAQQGERLHHPIMTRENLWPSQARSFSQTAST